jgi:hypothetical protein
LRPMEDRIGGDGTRYADDELKIWMLSPEPRNLFHRQVLCPIFTCMFFFPCGCAANILI